MATIKEPWYYTAQNGLRHNTLNWDLDVEIKGNSKILPYYALITGGMQHFVVFRGKKSFENYKEDFIDTVGYIDLDKAIYIGNYIAFQIQYDNY